MAEKRQTNRPRRQNGKPSGPRRWLSIFFYTLAFALMGFYLFGDKDGKAASKELSYTKLTAYIEVGAVEIDVGNLHIAICRILPDDVQLLPGVVRRAERGANVVGVGRCRRSR